MQSMMKQLREIKEAISNFWGDCDKEKRLNIIFAIVIIAAFCVHPILTLLPLFLWIVTVNREKL